MPPPQYSVRIPPFVSRDLSRDHVGPGEHVDRDFLPDPRGRDFSLCGLFRRPHGLFNTFWRPVLGLSDDLSGEL